MIPNPCYEKNASILQQYLEFDCLDIPKKSPIRFQYFVHSIHGNSLGDSDVRALHLNWLPLPGFDL